MKKLILLLAIPLLAVACGGGNGGNSKPVSNESVAGSWKHTQTVVDGRTYNVSESEEEDTHIYNINKDGTFTVEVRDSETNEYKYIIGPLNYKVEGNTIITIDEDGFSMPDYRVLAVTDNQIQLDLLDPEESDPSNLVMIMTRVEPSKDSKSKGSKKKQTASEEADVDAGEED